MPRPASPVRGSSEQGAHADQREHEGQTEEEADGHPGSRGVASRESGGVCGAEPEEARERQLAVSAHLDQGWRKQVVRSCLPHKIHYGVTMAVNRTLPREFPSRSKPVGVRGQVPSIVNMRTSCSAISARVNGKVTHRPRENSRVWSSDHGERGFSYWL